MGRSPCCVVDHVNKGAWAAEEDRLLVAYIQAHGEGNWKSLPDAAGLQRCGKSCRLRWKNYLRPDLKRGGFTTEEENVIIKLQGLLGNRWSRIAASLPRRTDNEIKNHWNTYIKRKLLKKGDVIFKTVTSCRIYRTDGVDLDLTISPPSSFSPPSSSSTSSASSSTTDPTSGSSRQWTAATRDPAVMSAIVNECHRNNGRPPLCFCYDLGFKGSDECHCQ